ncbi:MAG: hypothetical protein IKJ42_10870 [Bacteroidaceae bacterium]|nr:hypothetical protein [Bacteroidaceae bacterium]
MMKVTVTLESGRRVVLKHPKELKSSLQEVVLVFAAQMYHGVVKYVGRGEIHLTKGDNSRNPLGLCFPYDRLIGWFYK